MRTQEFGDPLRFEYFKDERRERDGEGRAERLNEGEKETMVRDKLLGKVKKSNRPRSPPYSSTSFGLRERICSEDDGQEDGRIDLGIAVSLSRLYLMRRSGNLDWVLVFAGRCCWQHPLRLWVFSKHRQD